MAPRLAVTGRAWGMNYASSVAPRIRPEVREQLRKLAAFLRSELESGDTEGAAFALLCDLSRKGISPEVTA